MTDVNFPEKSASWARFKPISAKNRLLGLSAGPETWQLLDHILYNNPAAVADGIAELVLAELEKLRAAAEKRRMKVAARGGRKRRRLKGW